MTRTRQNLSQERRSEPTPGDVGRFALHMDPFVFAKQVMQWCEPDDDTTERVTVWFEAVYLAMREHSRPPAT